LSNTIAFFDCEVNLAEIEENNFEWSTIVGVNNACASIDAVFGS
jgi:hypothetical protein